MDPFILYTLVAGHEAWSQAGLPDKLTDREGDKTGCLIGVAFGGVDHILEVYDIMFDRGPRRVSPFFIPGSLINLCSGQVSIRYGYKGPNHAVVTACSTGAHAIGDASRLIMLDDADVMIAGGAD